MDAKICLLGLVCLSFFAAGCGGDSETDEPVMQQEAESTTTTVSNELLRKNANLGVTTAIAKLDIASVKATNVIAELPLEETIEPVEESYLVFELDFSSEDGSTRNYLKSEMQLQFAEQSSILTPEYLFLDGESVESFAVGQETTSVKAVYLTSTLLDNLDDTKFIMDNQDFVVENSAGAAFNELVLG